MGRRRWHLADHLIGGFEHGLGLADKSDDGAVGGLTGIDIEQFDTLDLFDLGGDLIDNIHVAALADIGHTFNKLLHYFRFYVFCKDTIIF